MQKLGLENNNDYKIDLNSSCCRVAVIGSREPSRSSLQKLRTGLDLLLNKISDNSKIKIVSGGAFGADTFAMEYAIEHKLQLLVFAPNGFHNKNFCIKCKNYNGVEIINTGLSYQGRNQLIIDNADIVMVPDYGNGTIDSMNRAIKQNIPIYCFGKYILGKYKKITPKEIIFM